MKRFYKKVELDSRKAMEDFLTGHFRYNTMNSWNRSTSYANCLKIDRLELTDGLLTKAYEIIGCSEIYDVFNRLIRDWSDAHDWEWQAGFNGRSGGYLVLYRGGLDWKNAKTAKCDCCGKLWAAPIFYDSCNERISSWFLSSAAAPREWVPLLVGAEGGPFRSMARCA